MKQKQYERKNIHIKKIEVCRSRVQNTLPDFKKNDNELLIMVHHEYIIFRKFTQKVYIIIIIQK